MQLSCSLGPVTSKILHPPLFHRISIFKQLVHKGSLSKNKYRNHYLRFIITEKKLSSPAIFVASKRSRKNGGGSVARSEQTDLNQMEVLKAKYNLNKKRVSFISVCTSFYNM